MIVQGCRARETQFHPSLSYITLSSPTLHTHTPHKSKTEICPTRPSFKNLCLYLCPSCKPSSSSLLPARGSENLASEWRTASRRTSASDSLCGDLCRPCSLHSCRQHNLWNLLLSPSAYCCRIPLSLSYQSSCGRRILWNLLSTPFACCRRSLLSHLSHSCRQGIL